MYIKSGIANTLQGNYTSSFLAILWFLFCSMKIHTEVLKDENIVVDIVGL